MAKGGKDLIRKPISDAQLRSELRKLFSKGITQKSDAYGQIRTKFSMGRSRFWKTYDSVHSDWAKLKDKAESEGISESTKEAVKTGLKSKLEKQLHIQNQIDAIQEDIDSLIFDPVGVDEEEAPVLLKDKIKVSETKAFLRKVMRDLYAELNKMEGDYAAANVKHSGEVVQRLIIEDTQNCEPLLNESNTSI